MSQKQLDDLNIESQEVLITPRALKEKHLLGFDVEIV